MKTTKSNAIQPKSLQYRGRGYRLTILPVSSLKGAIGRAHNDLDLKHQKPVAYVVPEINGYSFFDETDLSYTDDLPRSSPLAGYWFYKQTCLSLSVRELLSDIPTDGMYQPRLTGPIQFLVKLLKTWNLSRADAIPLLGLEETERAYAENLLTGRARLRGRDLKHRIACLFRIRKTLYALFRDEKVENDWLREPHDALDGQRPMDVMLEGSMENLLLVKEYVEEAAGL